MQRRRKIKSRFISIALVDQSAAQVIKTESIFITDAHWSNTNK